MQEATNVDFIFSRIIGQAEYIVSLIIRRNKPVSMAAWESVRQLVLVGCDFSFPRIT